MISGPMAGQSFSLTCSLSGGASLQPTLSYQWTREGGSLMTSTATLNFDTLYLSNAGQYSCQVILTSSQLEGGHTVAAHYTIEFRSKLLYDQFHMNVHVPRLHCLYSSILASVCYLLIPIIPHSTGLHIQLGLEGITNCRVYTEQD